MMAKHVVPEERLLKLIRKKDFKFPPAVGMSINDSRARSRIPIRISLRAVNTVLVLLAVILAVYLLAGFLFSNRSVQPSEDSGVVSPAPDSRPAQIPPAKPYDYYAKQFEGKDIFGVSSAQDSSFSLPLGQSASQMAKDLKLVGVVMDAQPQAAIENKAENKTYFLQAGEYINGLKLEAINENRVILIYAGQKIELSL